MSWQGRGDWVKDWATPETSVAPTRLERPRKPGFLLSLLLAFTCSVQQMLAG